MTHTTTLAFVGDIFLSGSYRDVPDAAQRRMFEGLAGALQNCSLVFGNFEGVVMAEEPSGLVPDKIRMSVAPAYLPALRAAGIDVLSLSNNHVFDYGTAAFEASRGALDRAGFTVFGAGLSDDEALNWTYDALREGNTMADRPFLDIAQTRGVLEALAVEQPDLRQLQLERVMDNSVLEALDRRGLLPPP